MVRSAQARSAARLAKPRSETSGARQSSERRGIQSADRAIDMLLALVEAGRATSLKELAGLAEMPASLAHRYLASLATRGLATQNATTGLYDLGPTAIRIGASALARVDALASAAAAMPNLVAETGLTALLCVLGDRGATIVRWERSPIPFATSLAVGAVLPATGSATGRSILAFLPERLRRNVIARAPEADDSVAGALDDRLATIRARGYDTADSTVVPGLSAVSAPILDAQNEAVAAITLVASHTEKDKALKKAIARLIDTCAGISRAAGSDLPIA